MFSISFPVLEDLALASNARAVSKPSLSAKLKTSPAASSPSTGPTCPATPTCESLPANDLLPMELPLMSSAEASPARTSAQPETERDWLASAAGYGQRSPVWLANFDRDTSSWRTSQHCLVEGLEVFSETWPRSGTMLAGTASKPVL